MKLNSAVCVDKTGWYNMCNVVEWKHDIFYVHILHIFDLQHLPRH